MSINKLIHRKIQTAKPINILYKIFDAHGFYVLIKPNGMQYWSTSKTKLILGNSKRNVWWQEGKEGWEFNSVRSGNFLYTR